MRTLARNRRTLYYANPTSAEPQYDAYGNETGSPNIIYSQPVLVDVNVSAGTGLADLKAYGITENYDRSFVTHDMDCPITEESILWFGVSPSEAHNYVVAGKHDSLNSILYTIKEVSTT